MKNLLTLLFCFSCFYLFAQKHDNIWMSGYTNSGGADPDFGTSVIDFNIEPPEVSREIFAVNFALTASGICNANGNLQFYMNGVEIGNFTHNLMENGDGLNPSLYTELNDDGFNFFHTALALPIPEKDNEYSLFHLSIEYPTDSLSWHSPVMYRTHIDMNTNGGEGTVIEKNVPIISDTLMTSGLTATKHANGRDWWIIFPEFDNGKFYKILQTPDTAFINDVQAVGDTIYSSVSQAVFSPDGSKYIRGTNNGLVDNINIYDFDRCTGELSNHLHIQLIDDGNGPGVGAIVSPNSRYLYVSLYDHLWQYDLVSTDIEASQILIDTFDGFTDIIWGTRFGAGLLAPNHKIYVATSGSGRYLHTIERPNEQGIDCRFIQRAINLPTWNRPSIPNYPHFRLGPIDGSPCDTLGIDNHPVAAWVHDLEELTVKFTDYSYYEPTEWFWDFGDNQTSNEQQPTHEYAEEGTYEVCLTVSNEFDSDSLCKMVEVIISDVEDLEFEKGFAVFPNPSSGEIQLKMQQPLSENGWFILYDNLGERVFEQEVLKGSVLEVFDFQDFAKGMYFYEIREGDLKIGAGKIVLME